MQYLILLDLNGTFLCRHRLLVEMGSLALRSGHTDLTKVILDALSSIRLQVKKKMHTFDCSARKGRG